MGIVDDGAKTKGGADTWVVERGSWNDDDDVSRANGDFEMECDDEAGGWVVCSSYIGICGCTSPVMNDTMQVPLRVGVS